MVKTAQKKQECLSLGTLCSPLNLCEPSCQGKEWQEDLT